MTILDDRAAKAIQEAMDARVRALSANHPTTHMAEVIEVDQDGITWVHVFGGADRTPAIRSLAKVKKGDLVTVTIEEGVVTINGSSSNPAATVEYVEAANYAVAEYAKQAIAGVLGDVLQVKNAIIEKATIEDLTAVNATVQNLTTAYANINELVAGKADIVDLTAATGRISQLEADDVTINGKITAAEGRIGTIESDYLTTTDMEAEVARVGTLLTDYAEIDLANVNNAWISNGIINKAAIFDANVFDITGQTATISEINAANINVTNLHTSNLTVDTADGYVTIGNKKTPTKEFLDSLKNELQQEIDGAVETFTVDHVPLMLNAPATDWALNRSDYDTQQEYEEAQRRAYAKHVGDIAYVTNPAVDQNGYCYRFTYDSTLQEFKWVLIKDSDVTKALSDISDLQTFESETSTWINETDQGLETIRTNHTTLSGVVDKTVKKSVQLWYTKANTTAPDPPTSQVTSTSTSGNGWRVVVPAWNASYPNYYYCWQYELADGTFSWSPVVRDIAMGESQGTSRSAQTTADANIKSNVQLWFTKANNTSPDKPTTVVTTNNAGTANAWNIAVPTYNSSYPHYFYCYQQQKGDGTYQWTDVVYDKGTTESMEKAQAALPISSFNTFQQTTFKDVKDTVDEQSSTITQMQSSISEKADGSTVSALSTTVNEVSQTATSNSSVISQLATTLGTNADGTTKAGDVVQRMSAAEQDLSGFKTTVSNTYATNNDLNTTNGNVAAAQADATSALNRQVAYSGTSSTGATTAAKVVTCTNFPALAAGVTITVRFSVANTSAGALTLNVNSTGAKTIYVSGAATAAANQLIWAANANISFTYDGTYWRVDSEPRTWFGTCSTAEGTARKDSTVNEVVFCKGTTVALNMTNANTSTSATLNLLGSSLTAGAKNLYYGTSTTRPTTENGYGWGAASTAVFVFDGQYWRVGDTSTMSRLNAAETTITNHTTSIQQNATDITSKASQTEVDTLTGRVSSAESSITQTATSITSLVANNDTYTAPDGTTKTNTIKSAIKQNADAIDLRVEKSGVIAAINASVEQEGGSAVKISADKVNVEGATIFTSGRLSQTSLNNAYDAKGAAAAVQTNLDNMEVGGRNLLANTSNEWTEVSLTTSQWFLEVHTDYALEIGQQYTFSIIVEKVSSDTVAINLHLGNGVQGQYTHDIGAWRQNDIPFGEVVSITHTITEADLAKTSSDATIAPYFSFRLRNEKNATTIRYKCVKLEKGNIATDWTPAPEDMATTGDVAATQPLVIGTQTAATRFWTGNCPEVSSLIQGQHITYFLPYAYKKETAQSKGITAAELVPTETVTTEYSNDWLKLTLSDGSDTGWVPIYYQGTTRLTSHYGAGMVIPLVYREGYSSSIPRGWWGASQYYVNNIDRTQHANTCKATATNYKTINSVNYGIVASSIIGYISDGYKTLAAGDSIDLSQPILWATGDVKTSATFTNAYEVYSSCTLRNNVASWSGITYAMAYLVGTVVGNTFTLDSTTPITSTEPQSEDGKIYLPIGQLYSAYQIAFRTCKDLYAYIDGKFRQVTPTEILASQYVYIQAASGTMSVDAPDSWVEELGESVATEGADSQSGDQGQFEPVWTTKRPTYNSDYPLVYVATQHKRLDGTVSCSIPLRDDSTTIIDGGHITTGVIDASKVSVTNLNASNITSGTIDAKLIDAEKLSIKFTNVDGLSEELNGKASTSDVQDVQGELSKSIGALESKTDNAIGELSQSTSLLDERVGYFEGHFYTTTVGEGAASQPAFVISADGNIDSSGLKTVLTNSSLMFQDGGQTVAQVTNQELDITRTKVTESMQLGNFMWIPLSDGSLAFKWIES